MANPLSVAAEEAKRRALQMMAGGLPASDPEAFREDPVVRGVDEIAGGVTLGIPVSQAVENAVTGEGLRISANKSNEEFAKEAVLAGLSGKGQMRQHVRNLQKFLKGSDKSALIGRDDALLAKDIAIHRGDAKSGYEHIQKHIDDGNIKEDDLFRLIEVLNTPTRRAQVGSKKVYYGKPENDSIGTLVGIVGDNEGKSAPLITAFRKKNPEQFEKLFEVPGSGGTANLPIRPRRVESPSDQSAGGGFSALRSRDNSISDAVVDVKDSALSRMADEPYYRFDYGSNSPYEWFSKNRDYAEEYGRLLSSRGVKGDIVGRKIKLENPLIVNARQKEFADPDFEMRHISHAEKNGHDGVVFREPVEGDEFVVLFRKKGGQ